MISIKPSIFRRFVPALRRRPGATLRSFDLKKWKFGVLAGIVVVVVTAIPQINIIVRRGNDWQGSYALIDYDELVYSSYTHSLIEGRPRRNDPYSSPKEPGKEVEENLFSIQFLPAYAMVLPARILGLSTSTAFILLLPLMAFASSLALFWLLTQVTGDQKIAAVGVLLVLLCGRLVSENPFVSLQFYGSFAFLRRYIPAVPFPLFFVFCGAVWRAFTIQSRRALVWAIAAGLIFGVLVFSYFYLWTAAAAWLFCFSLIWLIARPTERLHALFYMSLVGGTSLCTLIPYFYLLSLRAKTTDTSQALEYTHAPDLFRICEIVGLLILLALAWQARRKTINWRSPRVVFAASCAAAPFLVFNQQVLTGRSLQPFHYEQFIINYVVLVGLVATYQLLWRQLKIRLAVWMIFALLVGIATALKEAHDNAPLNMPRDQAEQVFKRIETLSSQLPDRGFAISSSTLLAASAPTSCSVPELWSPHMYLYESTGSDERLERFYQYLYYLGVDAKSLEMDLQNSPQTRAAVFGLPRANAVLSSNFQPVSANEIDAQVRSYSAYIAAFSREQASRWRLSYVILIDETPYDLSNLDRWYVRDEGQRAEDSIIYSVRLRTE